MNKNFLLLCLLVISMPMILAENGIEIKIQNQTITVRGYTQDPIYGKVDFGFFEKLDDTFGTGMSCDNLTINNQTYQTNCSLNIAYNKDIPIYTQNESATTIIGDTSLYQQLIVCETTKAQYNAGLNACVTDKGDIKEISQNYTQCSSSLQLTQGEKTILQKEVIDLEEEVQENENKCWWFGIVGLIIGAGVIAYKEGLIGGPKTKKPDETFNARQSA